VLALGEGASGAGLPIATPPLTVDAAVRADGKGAGVVALGPALACGRSRQPAPASSRPVTKIRMALALTKRTSV
jgi:hypothetical protein